MYAREPIINPAVIDFNHVVADIGAIRDVIPQRGAIEQLTAILVDDVDKQVCVSLKDVRTDEFWVSGHMPGMPIMPGVLLCEAAAQTFSYYVQKHDILGVPIVGFGGLDGVRFRGLARPGDRLVIACQLTKCRPGRVTQCRFQIFVGTTVISDGEIVGVPLPVDLPQSASPSTATFTSTSSTSQSTMTDRSPMASRLTIARRVRPISR